MEGVGERIRKNGVRQYARREYKLCLNSDSGSAGFGVILECIAVGYGSKDARPRC